MKSNARALSTAGPAREICASSVVARGIGSGGCGPHLHDRRSVVGDGGDALVVVDELVEPAGTLRARSGWGGGGVVGRSAGNTKTAKKDGWRARRRSRASFGGEAHQGGADGVHDRHARVDVGDQLALALARVRALAQEHDLGLLRRGRRGEGVRAVRDRAIAGAFENDPTRARTRGNAGGRVARGSSVGRGLGRHTHDHLPVGHLHQRARHDDRPRGDQCARATSVDSFCLNCCPRVSRRLRASLRATREEW